MILLMTLLRFDLLAIALFSFAAPLRPQCTMIHQVQVLSTHSETLARSFDVKSKINKKSDWIIGNRKTVTLSLPSMGVADVFHPNMSRLQTIRAIWGLLEWICPGIASEVHTNYGSIRYTPQMPLYLGT